MGESKAGISDSPSEICDKGLNQNPGFASFPCEVLQKYVKEGESNPALASFP